MVEPASRLDQARRLRGLVEQNQQRHERLECSTSSTTTIAITSGKGGVGKSSLALNLAIALGRLEARVCLFDINLGLGHIDLMCGLNGYWNLGHVLGGSRQLSDIMLEGPGGIRIVPGAGELTTTPVEAGRIGEEVRRQLIEVEQNHDLLVFDTGSGFHPFVRRCLAAADTVLVVTTPEPTAIADAYATIKSLPLSSTGHLLTLVNRADSEQQAREIHDRLAQTTRMFLEKEPGRGGWVPEDPAVATAIHERVPVMLAEPDCPAARALDQLARRLFYRAVVPPDRPAFFERLLPGPMARAA